MNDNSLMNPIFVREEIAGEQKLLEEMHDFATTMSLECNEIYDMFRQMTAIDPKRETYTISHDQMIHIVTTLTQYEGRQYAYVSPRRVSISQYTQLLKDRRYRIATAILKLFRK